MNAKTVYPEAAANVPCPHCAEPVGYGNHVSYCPKNPVNQARVCSNHGPNCNGPGVHVTDHGYAWVCDWHHELEILQCRHNSAEGSVIYTTSRIANLEKELAAERAKLPDLMAEKVVRRQQLADHWKRVGVTYA